MVNFSLLSLSQVLRVGVSAYLIADVRVDHSRPRQFNIDFYSTFKMHMVTELLTQSNRQP